MKLETNRIEKVKVIKVNKNNIIVLNNKKQKGIIYITEMSHFFVANVFDEYKVGNVVYAYLLKQEDENRYYSLKVGHVKEEERFAMEVGGGFLGLKHLVEKLEKVETSRNFY